MLKQSLQRHAAMIKFYDYWKFETLLIVTTEKKKKKKKNFVEDDYRNTPTMFTFLK
jgi:hypothetical protein